MPRAQQALITRNYVEAEQIADKGIATLGRVHAPASMISLDDTGLGLAAAEGEKKRGQFQFAAMEKISVLETRLNMYRRVHSCFDKP